KIQLILDNSSPKQAALVELSLNEIIRNFLGEKKPVNLEVQRLYKSSKDPRKILLPSWLLFAIISSFMIVSASFLEEKEKKTLQAILISPASLSEIILGKIFLGLFLTLISTFLILILNGGMSGNLLNLFLIILLGSFYFCIVGIFISLLASNQGASNTLGSLLYLLFFMPVVLADTSRAMFNIAKFLPSFYILDGLSKALILNFGIGALKFHYLFLFLASLLLLGGNFLILRRQEN
ncbi:MAG: ABC transporter permease, partial [Armatimonadetes bacterium]|nr:ABC transporter permease [Armatimonadota bacterium]